MKDVDGTGDALDRRLRELPAEVPPARDLWPGIAARIEAERQEAYPARARASWRVVALAASVALAAVLGVSHYVRDAPRETHRAPVLVTVPPISISTFGSGHDLGTEYHAARAGLADDLERRLEALSPEARETVRENLEVIRRAAAEIDAALAEHPGNGLLQHQLLSAYQDELNVLANMQRVTARLPSRNEI
jgi:hypothetical protein